MYDYTRTYLHPVEGREREREREQRERERRALVAEPPVAEQV